MPRFIFSFLLTFLFFAESAADVAAGAEKLEEVFKGQPPATIVISSLSGKRHVYNEARARIRFCPASTFKILNTLIAVNEGVVSGSEHAFSWDGVERSIPGWNADQTLASAFKVSCVWCFQEIALKVGKSPYKRVLEQIAYGALEKPFDLKEFWLDGSLSVSANEQIAFMKAVFTRSLPFGSSAYNVLREIMLVEKTNSYALYAKTGWGVQSLPKIGWYVGYVETADDVWFFALNMDTNTESELPLRQQLARSSLRALGII